MRKMLLLLLSLVLFGTSVLSAGALDCDLAKAKCAYRASCYKSLHSYMLDCADVLTGRTSRCPYACQRALIALTSTEVGAQLASCSCREDDDFCRRSKERAEVCRPAVAHATADHTVVSCSVAHWICGADTLCSTALEYYRSLCRPMFHGRKCTPRCNNSLAILDRQEKAAKLRDCFCDGSEDFPCVDIKRNTRRLCYGETEEDWSEEGDGDLLDPATPSAGVAVVPPSILLLWCCVGAWVAAKNTNCWPWWWTSEG